MAKRKPQAPLGYTVRQVAERLGINYRTLLRQVQADNVPAIRIGSSRLYVIPAKWVEEATAGIYAQWLEVMQGDGANDSGPAPASVEPPLPEAPQDDDD